ncbi:thiol reductant ABC exporter subunit CydC [Neorhizobium sp. NCHU2750]|uniref:thiol reductant ABC exporter subunit CydC n=1 Tax=Neorhizobium sp. NCHU2750 TaxID=1825976 RepID=UPI000E7071E7|nr:ABC transporter permease [Neorhizobium sp. NCHU2750]
MRDLYRLFVIARPWYGRMALGIALSVIVILSNVALLALSGWFITAMALAGLGVLSLEFFTPAAAIRGLAVLRTIARYLERLVTHDATFAVLAELRVWLFAKLEPLAPARLQNFRDGDVLARFRNDIDSLSHFYLKVMVPACAAAIASLALLAFLAVFSPVVAVIEAIALMLAGIVIPLMVQSLSARRGAAVAHARADLQAGSVDLIRGLDELQVAGAVSDKSAGLLERSRDLIEAQRTITRLSAGGNAASGLVGQGAVLATFVMVFAAKGETAWSSPFAVMLLFAVMAGGEIVTALPAAFAALGVAVEAARRIFIISDLEPAVRAPLSTPSVGALPTSFDVSFRNVTMRYAPTGPFVLTNFSFTLRQGGHLTLAGPSGSGKTTVLDLLQHFWEPEVGEILIGGRNIRDLPDDVLRRIITVVGQHTHLFNATVRDNLRLVRPDADDADIWHALEQSSIADEIRALPAGLDTVVGELGAYLSGGQARRIAIARAFLSDAPIVLLDEPTEGLDALNAHRVSLALDRFLKGRTAIIVSHRKGIADSSRNHAHATTDMATRASEILKPKRSENDGRRDTIFLDRRLKDQATSR